MTDPAGWLAQAEDERPGNGTHRRKAPAAGRNGRAARVDKNVVFIGINLGLSGGVLLLLGVLVLMALVLVHGLRTANPKDEPRLVPVRMRSRRNVVRPGDEFLASTPSRAPPVLRRPFDDLGNPPRGA